MSSYNPRVIAHKLEDLQAELTRWAGAARDTLENATYTQLQSKEAVERTVRQAAIVLDRAKQDEEDVQKARSTVESLLAQSLEAQDVSHQTLHNAKEILDFAQQTLQTWREELAVALAWLKRAEARLAEAIRQYELARRALANAQAKFDRAVSSYNRCKRDPDRRNCNSEANAVNAAQREVQEATVWVMAAEQEVVAAQLEVELAKARVVCCQQAVEYAEQAVKLAQESESHAVEAVNSAERSLEFAQSAEKSSLLAEEQATGEMEAAESMVTTAQMALQQNDDAFVHLKRSDNAEDSAQRYVSIARQEIGHRMQLLSEVNRPSLGGTGGQLSSRGRGHATARKERIQEVPIDQIDPRDMEHVKGPGDFRDSAPYDVMVDGLKKLNEVVRPAVKNGAESDDFYALDQQKGLDYEHGYQRVYDAFYGSEPIRLEKEGNNYRLTGGAHRVFVAKQLGIKTLPASVVEIVRK